MTSLSTHSYPVLKSMFRLQWEEAQQAYVLLYPEGMVRLNDSAAEILKYCQGEQSVADISADLARKFEADDIQDDVMQFLAHAMERGWLQI